MKEVIKNITAPPVTAAVPEQKTNQHQPLRQDKFSTLRLAAFRTDK